MHRTAWAGVVGAVARSVRDLDLAEECAQEAFATAVDRWPVDGVPASPEGWLVTVARRRAVEQLRRRQTLRRRLPLLLLDEADTSAQGEQELVEERADRAREGTADVDFVSDRLRLLFTCCHPALAPEQQVALTARLVCGLTTQEAARVLLVGEATMAARITRAKKKIASAGIPFRVPTGAQLPERLDVVLTVVHVLATAGHMAPAGPGVVREDLLERALELSGSLVRVMPDEAEVLGLHALVLLCWARSHGRQDADGRLLLLQEQDRSTWDRSAVDEADRLVRRALRRRPPGRMVLQAAVAACHATAPATRRPTGGRWSASTTCCSPSGRPPPRSWRGPSRPAWRTGRPPGSPRWTAWPCSRPDRTRRRPAPTPSRAWAASARHGSSTSPPRRRPPTGRSDACCWTGSTSVMEDG